VHQDTTRSEPADANVPVKTLATTGKRARAGAGGREGGEAVSAAAVQNVEEEQPAKKCQVILGVGGWVGGWVGGCSVSVCLRACLYLGYCM
jgi:hypothetical protein